MAVKYLITGGARSGKSTYAEKLCISLCDKPEKRCYIATAQAFDEEMKNRIEIHKKNRGDTFITYEEPVNLGKIIIEKSCCYDVILVDCLTVWTSNLLYYLDDEGLKTEVDYFIDSFEKAKCNIVLVTNETGSGIVPDNEVSRKFRDVAGIINQKSASIATNVVLMVCGIPVCVKGSVKNENA